MVKIHFLNVGHGDCTVIEHANGNLTMIDINNGSGIDDDSFDDLIAELAPARRLEFAIRKARGESEESLLKAAGYKLELCNPVGFLSDRFPGRPIFRYVQSHPDLDHMRGLADMREAGITMVNFWDTTHTKQLDEGKASEGDITDWDEYQRLRSGSDPKVLRLVRGNRGKYWNENEDGSPGGNGLEILSPTPDLLRQFDVDGKRNELSYVLRYHYGGRSVVFGGDTEQNAWKSIYYHHVLTRQSLKCDLLKASHHGRANGFFLEAVKAMNPDYTIVSVGEKPTTDASHRYATQTNIEVLSTRRHGNITAILHADGRPIEIDSDFKCRQRAETAAAIAARRLTAGLFR
jgi:hypothetical protein